MASKNKMRGIDRNNDRNVPKKYQTMIDEKLEKFKNKELTFFDIEEVIKRNEILP